MTTAAPPNGGGIEIAGVTQVFRGADREVRALDAFDLNIRSGEFVSIVGPSGCGKSTLLRIVAGLLTPSGGTVTIDGRPVTRPQTAIGFVFQSPTLLEWRSVVDNVMLQIEMRGLQPRDYLARARELLASVGLAEFESELSRLASRHSGFETLNSGDGVHALDAVTASLPSGAPLVSDVSLEIKPGEKVLIKGVSGAGKSTLFSVIAGLWPSGRGKIHLPAEARSLFLPQKPYIPIGTLRSALWFTVGK